jgi:PAS domain S-box-containing protein/putative nucleotidyltransferase with HDIG domain
MTDRLDTFVEVGHEPIPGAPTEAQLILEAFDGILDGSVRTIPALNLNGASERFGHVASAMLALMSQLTDRERDLSLASAAVEHGAIAMSIFGRDGRYLRVNDETCHRTGFTPEEYSSMYVWDTAPEFTQERLDQMWDAYDPATPPRFSTLVRRKDGSQVPVDLAIRVMELHGEQYIVVFSSDVSERKRTEEALLESEQKFAHAFNGNPVGMSIFDGDGLYVEMNRAWEKYTGYTREEALGHHFAELPAWENASELEAAMSAFMDNGRLEGAEVSFLTKVGDRRIGVLTAELLQIGGRACVLGTIQDVTERKRAEKERLDSIVQLEALTQQTIATMAGLVEARDPYTAGHERRVTQLAVAIGTELGFDSQTLMGLRVSAQLHDIGKMVVPAEILAKPGKLSFAEFALVKGHAEAGASMLSTIDFPWPVMQIVLQHHERLDGSGYPLGVAADEILPEARLLAVADVVEAMSADRPYRPSLGLEAALAEIQRGRSTLYDDDAVDACLRLFAEGRFSFD